LSFLGFKISGHLLVASFQITFVVNLILPAI